MVLNLVYFVCLFGPLVCGSFLGAFSISKFHIFNHSKTYIKYRLFKHLTKCFCKTLLYLVCSSSIKYTI